MGKVVKGFNGLTEENLKSFDIIRDSLLKVYELAPEAYHQRFRNTVKQQGQSFGELSRRKKDLFNKRVNASGVRPLLN